LRTVYLDNNATTAVAPEVFEAMRPFYTEYYGNPSSVHHLGTQPAAAVREARKKIAAFLRCDEGELIFTSCGTEADNLAIRGVLEGEKKRMHIITSSVEHSAVLNVFKRMETLGHEVTYLGVDKQGQIDVDELRNAVRDDTSFMSLMFANNETGVLFPIDEIAAITKQHNIPFHVDAVQAIGKVPFDLATLPIDMMAMSAHKFHGPKGVGALFVRKKTRCSPVLLGGGQEHGRRPGTENVAGIVAMSVACDLASRHLPAYQTTVRQLRDKFEATLLDNTPDIYINGSESPRLPNTSSVCFRGVEGHAMIVLLDELGICASAGSACKSGAGAPSAVLAAMGLSQEDAAGTVRFSLSNLTTEDDIAYATEKIPQVVEKMRSASRQAAG
jgi:cysteine desulfurase